ncbi:hypothetical protein SmJEL517_g00454 [Synchytrium microbalum]|uniref:Carboxylesterase type B domain-containing protein n=1 Tax=Synchytrium microbalum TaxID=1806994 RepID=A0A507CHJ4_9FUNG|nr:uncharacterized protein SmJEL517_g00454 [Synchytrium microbalum]TPX37556.1 hypothetical protein SmJEL517_g00454 [Synchytrium microbalum]
MEIRINDLNIIGTATADGVHQFLGIPYALPPTGPLRFSSSLPHPIPFEQPFYATRYSPMCPQTASGSTGQPPFTVADGADIMDESSCLTLNVFATPDERTDKPVLVFIHGGGFVNGSASVVCYDGGGLVTAAASRGEPCILVTIQYRVGVLGFLSSREIGRGNFGIEDCACALRWVQQHIHAFGGDASKVCCFGQSSGAATVAFLMTCYPNERLFSTAICQSGVASIGLADAGYMQDVFDMVCDFTECPLGVSGEEKLKHLQSVPQDVLMQAVEALGQIFFSPIFDGVIVKESPQAALVRGDVPQHVKAVMVGYNEHEGASISGAFKTRGLVKQYIGMHFKEDIIHKIEHLYKVNEEGRDPRKIVSDICGDAMFAVPTRTTCRGIAKSRRTRCFSYRFNVPCHANTLSRKLGYVPHGWELPFLFNSSVLNDVEKRLGEDMAVAWVRFAESGDPNAGEDGKSVGVGGIVWPEYKDGCMVFELTKHRVEGDGVWRGEYMRFYEAKM